ncbi:helix-turn-helix domain-containing GNAT family N-acetyltransferase [Paenibacillus macerans]|uniref:bifunctional helix-turn-helix transcriptional regulator/GNAT family N-acetyltransferase n=1 Tax=Paenibacillus macerans TaxID=44252 RepID=UPI002DB5EBB6|nr:helix-turn-helix domain-containing GNAT family N-acetyltransferase [Paenibacillus macerans]MEC0328378.1 helix-turn-helix domain-containing GNAT family N-acetyltransferase [Paenibacillus macerans]
MNSVHHPIIQAVRRFNRFYTNILGLLDQHMLNSDFSLSEARVLYEIGNTPNCTAKMLIELLSIDPGYLSRIIKRFEKMGLAYREQSKEDGRLYYLFLTDQGKETLARLNGLSDGQIYQMISRLPEQEQLQLAQGMQSIEAALSEKPALTGEEIVIRSELRPGDAGYLVHLHGWIYQERGYNHRFEGYVCKTFYEFFENYSPGKDRFWFAEANGNMVGAIAIVEHSPDKAQLRWFVVHPQYRGIGLGRRLLDEAMNYCREKGYPKVFLETTEDQQQAIRMYTRVGFVKVAEHPSNDWGKPLVELTYELTQDK